MQRHHTGSGRLQVIPTDWSEHHRGVLETTRTATVQIRQPGGTAGTFDPATGTRTVTPNTAYYTGLARIQVLGSAEQVREVAEQQVSSMAYAVTLDHSLVGVQLDDLVRVLVVDDNGDAELVGRDLTVHAIERGSLHWERRLLCSDDLETTET